jgi:hypothetical protein
MKYEKQSTRNAKRKTQKIRQEKYLDALQRATENETMNKMINSNPRGGLRSGRYTASKGGTPAMKMQNGGRVGYKKGGSAQPNYKSGEMHKCMPN